MSELVNRQSILYCFCAPAGSGKSTISRAVVEADPKLVLSISTTTRSPRSGEEPGVHYYFVSESAFAQKVADGEFVEHAFFGSYRYGTEKRNIEAAAAAGCDLILDIDVQGVRALKQLYGEQVVTVFVFPPSFHALEERLRGRGTESAARQLERLRRAKEELEILRGEGFSDYLIVNDRLGDAIASAQAIVRAERLRYRRLSTSFLSKLLDPNG